MQPRYPLTIPIEDRLARLGTLVRDQKARASILAEALTHALPGEMDALALAVLTDAPSERGVRWLMERWPDRLSTSVRALLEDAGRTPGISTILGDLLMDTVSRVGGGNAEGSAGVISAIIGLAGVRRDPLMAPGLAHLFTVDACAGGGSAARGAASSAHSGQRSLDLGRLADAAAEALLRISQAWVERAVGIDQSLPQLLALDQALAVAFDTYPQSRRRPALLAVALLAHEPGPALARALAETEHPAHFALRGVLRTLAPEQLAPQALAWLGNDLLANQVVDRLPDLARRSDTFEQILTTAHLALLPNQSRRLQRLNPRRPAVVGTQSQRMLSSPAQVRLARWLTAIPMTPADRIAALAAMTELRSRSARLGGLRALIDHLPAPAWSDGTAVSVGNASGHEATARDAGVAVAAGTAIEHFCFDADPRIARIATFARLVAARAPRQAAAGSTAGSRDPHPESSFRRKLLSDHREGGARQVAGCFESFRSPSDAEGAEAFATAVVNAIDAWRQSQARGVASGDTDLRMSPGDGVECTPEFARIRLRHLRSMHPRAFDAHVVRLLQERDSHFVLDLLVLIEELNALEGAGLESAIAGAIFGLAEHPDARVTATSLRVLARLRHEAVPQVLNAVILRHPDRRVRANAIEALGRTEVGTLARYRGLIEPFARHAVDGRSQANAIRVLARVDAAAAQRCLRRMLRAPSAEHEASALWVMRRLREERGPQPAAAVAARGDTSSLVRLHHRPVALSIGPAASPSTSTADGADMQAGQEPAMGRAMHRGGQRTRSISPHLIAAVGVSFAFGNALVMAAVATEVSIVGAWSTALPAAEAAGGWTLIDVLALRPALQAIAGAAFLLVGLAVMARWGRDLRVMKAMAWSRPPRTRRVAAGPRMAVARGTVRRWVSQVVARALSSGGRPAREGLTRRLGGLVRRWRQLRAFEVWGALLRAERPRGSREIAAAYGLPPREVRRLQRLARRAGTPGGVWPLLISEGAWRRHENRWSETTADPSARSAEAGAG